MNSESTPQRFALAGAAFRVLAIDGADLNGPTPVTDTWLELAAGGRYDIGFAMPRNAVKLSLAGGAAALALSPDGEGDLPETSSRTVFDPSGYGRPAATPFDATSHFDRRFELAIGRKFGFLDGRPGRHWSINGRLFPHVPMLMVERGDLVELTIVNHSGALHPMHLHGHHALVLSRNGPARHRQSMVGRHPRCRSRRALRARVSRRQSGPLDGPLPQPPARRGRADVASCLCGRRVAVQDRREGAQPPGVRF